MDLTFKLNSGLRLETWILKLGEVYSWLRTAKIWVGKWCHIDVILFYFSSYVGPGSCCNLHVPIFFSWLVRLLDFKFSLISPLNAWGSWAILKSTMYVAPYEWENFLRQIIWLGIIGVENNHLYILCSWLHFFYNVKMWCAYMWWQPMSMACIYQCKVVPLPCEPK